MERFRFFVNVAGVQVPPSPVMPNRVALMVGLWDVMDILSRYRGTHATVDLETTTDAGTRVDRIFDSLEMDASHLASMAAPARVM